MMKGMSRRTGPACMIGLLVILVASCRQYRPPLTPPAPTGVSMGMPGCTYTFKAKTSDPDGDSIRYEFDWGDATPSDTSRAAPSDSMVLVPHVWENVGVYDVRVIARDAFDSCSQWSPPSRLTISTYAPGFRLSSISGDTVSLYPLLTAGPVYMVCWDLHCVNCIAEVDALLPFYDSLRAHGFTLLAVSVDRVDDSSRVKTFVASKGWHCPVLLDPTQIWKQQYRIIVKPTGILVNMDTAIVYRHVGFQKHDEDSIKAEILKWMPAPRSSQHVQSY